MFGGVTETKQGGVV